MAAPADLAAQSAAHADARARQLQRIEGIARPTGRQLPYRALVLLAGAGGARAGRARQAIEASLAARGLGLLHAGGGLSAASAASAGMAPAPAPGSRARPAPMRPRAVAEAAGADTGFDGGDDDWLGALEAAAREAAACRCQVGLWAMDDAVAPALRAAASNPQLVQALVAWGGRPDLVGAALARLDAATLVIAGGRGAPARAQRDAWQLLPSTRRLETVPALRARGSPPAAWRGACELAASWLARYLGAPASILGPLPR